MCSVTKWLFFRKKKILTYAAHDTQPISRLEKSLSKLGCSGQAGLSELRSILCPLVLYLKLSVDPFILALTELSSWVYYIHLQIFFNG